MTELFCPNCGAPQPSGAAHYCYRCGQPLALPAAPGYQAEPEEEGYHGEPAPEEGAEGVGDRVDWPERDAYVPHGAAGVGGDYPAGPSGQDGGFYTTAPGRTGDEGTDRGVPPPPAAPPPVAVYDTPPSRNRWLLPAGLLVAALLAFLAWRGVQAVVGPAELVWTPGPTATAGTELAGSLGEVTPETPVSHARPPTATFAPTAPLGPAPTFAATLAPAAIATAMPTVASPTSTSAPAAQPTASSAAPVPAPTAAPSPVATLAPTNPVMLSGRMLAYVSEASGQPQIYVVQADGQSARQLTTEGTNRAPAWAPDNASIYYVSDRGDRSGIYRFDLATGHEESVALAPGLGRPQTVAGVALSATQQQGGKYRLIIGNKVVFELNRPFDYHWLSDGSQVLIDPLADPREIYKVNLADGKPVTVAPQRSWNASWGPQGEILYVTNNPGVAFVFVAGNNGENPRRISPEDKWAQAPAWSPDGQWIAYVAGDGPAWNLYRMGADGSEVTKLADAANPDKSPAWEPNSQRIAFESNARGNWDIVVVDMNGNARTVAGTGANEYDPAWSY